MSVLCSGSFVADIMVPDLPYIGPPGSLTYAPKGITLTPGGHSGNVAIDLAQLGVADVHAVGSIGRDMMGRFLVEQLESSGVQVHAEVHEDSTTAKNVALLVKGEDKRFIAELTANSLLSSEYLRNSMNTSKPSVFFQGTLGGLPHIEEHLSALLSHVKSLGATTFIDVIPPSNGWGYLPSALPHVDIIHCNVEEGREITNLDNPIQIVNDLVDRGVKVAIVSGGDYGLTAATEELVVTIPAFLVEQVDPTGAGDALCAGIISRIASMKPIQFMEKDVFTETLVYGQATGAACVTGVGATTNVKTEIIDRILESKQDVLAKTKTMRK